MSLKDHWVQAGCCLADCAEHMQNRKANYRAAVTDRREKRDKSVCGKVSVHINSIFFTVGQLIKPNQSTADAEAL